MYATGQYDYQMLQQLQQILQQLKLVVDWLTNFRSAYDNAVLWLQQQLPQAFTVLCAVLLLLFGVHYVLVLFFPSGGSFRC